ncbi:hypothetical protein DNTS_030090 [Danionella cerebrum]|uniref:Ubiquitin-like-conjugating enzyme ATG10 n=1 Tax=Danionella cerebrum TaxID=2873325 RepID=A0A553Q1S9_9TELE|nr:hypothetical protein DNTS_030090 [Danionella translucida]TRY83856.1 hypothetical protein DNTS_030090 [Danionella translucida]
MGQMAGDRNPVSAFLDERSFRLSCRHFLHHSDSIHDDWRWESLKDSDEGFMKKTVLIPVKSSAFQKQSDSMESETWGVLTGDTEVEDSGGSESLGVLRYEYHVVYSCSYQIPVLYFRASALDGRSLSLEEVRSNVHPHYRQRLNLAPWETLTQQEHPILGQPFFMLHPCHTEEFMKAALDSARLENKKVNYIVSWLSFVGPVVGLNIPLSFSTAVSAPD